MKKYYIPISTFNFNNILSSESISPKSFYEYRGFGYSRWLTIPENNIDNVILLYEKPFGFSRPKSDIEDHAMLVEITTDECFPQVDNGIYYSDHTIYLSPWKTKFIFFSEQVKRIVMSLSDSSLETKMMRIYGRWFIVEQHPTQNIPEVSLNIDLNKNEIIKDFRLNKMKGLLYGYYIGALLSISPDLVRKHNLLQELKDIFYAVLSSEKREITPYQNDRLNALFATLNKFNPAISFLQAKLATPKDIELVVNQLTKFNVIFPDIVYKGEIINFLIYSSSEKNQAIIWLENEFKKLKKQILQERKLLSVSAEEVIVTDCFLNKISSKVISDEQENKLMKNWVNDILCSKNYNGNISSFKEILSDEVTRNAKTLFSNSWEDSFAKQILNQIRKYVRGQESSIQWSNDLYSSIATVLSKGNNWTDLLSFMKSKGMSDYRLAFAFYGELNGFANLTRDFTDYIFNISEWEYLLEVYKEIYGQLLQSDPTYNPNNTINQPIALNVEKKENSSANNKYNELLKFADKEFKGSDKKILIDSLYLYLKAYDKDFDYETLLKNLLQKEEWMKSDGSPKKAWCKIQEKFAPNLKVKKQNLKRRNNRNELGSLFEKKKYFYNDENAWLIIKSVIPVENQSKIKNDLDWFQKEFCKPRNERYQYYQDIDVTDIHIVINKFCKLKENKAIYFSSEIRELVRMKLLEYYGWK